MTGMRLSRCNQAFIAGIDVDRILAAKPGRQVVHQFIYSFPARLKTVSQFTRHCQGMHALAGRKGFQNTGDRVRQRINTLPQGCRKLVKAA